MEKLKYYFYMKTNWNYPTSVWVGENRGKDLHMACNNLNINNASAKFNFIF